MIDLHCHLLPGLDDGPDSLAESVVMCRHAVACGTTRAIVTPHIHPGRWDNTPTGIAAALQRLRDALADENIPLQLGFAAEVRLSERIIAQVEEDTLPVYGEVDGWRILLLEFPHGAIPVGADKLARWLLDRGIRPLIAHPERNRALMRDISSLYRFTDMGCWLQLTGGSLCGRFGESAGKLARQLLDENLVAVVASDGHNLGARPPDLSQAYQVLEAGYGLELAERLLRHEPARISAQQFGTSGEVSGMVTGL